jgi:oligoendopeptidase F
MQTGLNSGTTLQFLTTSTTPAKPKAVKQRSEIDARYKWRLEDIYESDDLWRADLATLKEMLPKFESFKGRLAESGETLFGLLDHRDQTSILFTSCMSCLSETDEDNRASQYQAHDR